MTKRTGLVCALVALVVVGFWPALGAEFLGWDDDRNFLLNVHYRGLALENLQWMFTTFHMGPYQPLAWLTLGIDHALWGMDARGYHATNIMLHAVAVVLFFVLARRLFVIARPSWSNTGSDACAFVAALVFGVHPLRVESVAWITERRDVLSGLFFVATVIAWIGYATANERRGLKYGTALVLFVCALLSKASVVTLPFVLFALDCWPLSRWKTMKRRVLLEKLPFLALSITFAVIAVVGQRATGTAMRGLEDHDLVDRAAQASYAVLFQTWKTLWPSGLSPIYDMPSPFEPFTVRFIASALFVVVTCFVAWWMRTRWPAISVGWFAFLVLLAPVSGIVAVGPQLVADRYTYLACMPFALMLAGALGLAWQRRASRIIATAAAVLVSAALVGATHLQTKHWRTSTTLWERAYAVDPRSAVACDHLGVMRVMQSQDPSLDTATRIRLLDEAIMLYTRAYENAPHPNHVFNIGGAVSQRAPLDPATRIQEFELAAETMQMGIEFAERTTGVDPRWRVMYASVLIELKRYADAEAHLDLVQKVQPDNIAALQWRARIALEQGRTEEALALLKRTVAIDAESAALWSVLANTYRALGRDTEADEAEVRAARARAAAGR
ncbi:MAG: tetratricopeptide repeat protein [Planctomycetes bacterium]|nr:tetratricopeptide repeat protein [Planctomycetota bacterium]